MKQKSFALRANPDLLDGVQALARRKNLSANALWLEAMEAYLKGEEDKAWAESFEAMANDPEAMDIEYARFAQAEVMLANPS
jgi:hypothetical protein